MLRPTKAVFEQESAAVTLFDEVDRRLSSFHSHALPDSPETALMDRVDTKYLVPASMLGGLLDELKNHCSVLDIDGRRIARYRTQYYDTAELRHYHAHQNGSLSRYKVRYRTYVDQRTTFLEVKRKNNKGRIIKRRVAVDDDAMINMKAHDEFLRSCGVSQAGELIETQTCEYHRASFDNRITAERLTLDFNLAYADSQDGRRASVEDLAILELKQPMFSRDSGLFTALRQFKCRACSFSKYCIGLCLLRGKTLKANRFKETLLKIEKLRGRSDDGRTPIARGGDLKAGAGQHKRTDQCCKQAAL